MGQCQSKANFELARASENDIDEMGKLWAGLVLEENPNANPDIKKWNSIQANLIQLSNYYAYVVRQNGDTVGFNNGLVMNDIETGEKYVDGGNFYVLPQYRGLAAGRLLHRNSIEIMKKVGAKFIRRKVSANNQRMLDRMKLKEGKRYFIKEYIVDEYL